MFIAKIVVTDFMAWRDTEFIISKTGRAIYWKTRYAAKVFSTRQKARIAAKDIFARRDKKIYIYEVTPALEAEMLVEKLKGH